MRPSCMELTMEFALCTWSAFKGHATKKKITNCTAFPVLSGM